MKILSSDLVNLPVYTQSEIHLGRVASFEINTDNGKIENFHVKTGLIEGLWHEQLTIHYSQVVEIAEKRMTVEDSVGKEKAPDLNLASAVK